MMPSTVFSELFSVGADPKSGLRVWFTFVTPRNKYQWALPSYGV
jgi:hypothetical protein